MAEATNALPEVWEDEHGELILPPVFEQDPGHYTPGKRTYKGGDTPKTRYHAKQSADRWKKKEMAKRKTQESAYDTIDEAGNLPARHGGNAQVSLKGDEWKGKAGPEYSKRTAFQNKKNSGDIGSADAPGDYDDASEEGDGQYVETGTWPESTYDEDYVDQLRERIAFLENELAQYEDTMMEQRDTIAQFREHAKKAEVARLRAEALERHPELRVIEKSLLACESVEELNSRLDMAKVLVEDNRTVEQQPTPPEGGNGSSSVQPRDGVPTGPLNESSSPLSDRLGAGVRLGSGDVASRVAAHRRRRRKR
jgi:hypothetical protein